MWFTFPFSLHLTPWEFVDTLVPLVLPCPHAHVWARSVGAQGNLWLLVSRHPMAGLGAGVWRVLLAVWLPLENLCSFLGPLSCPHLTSPPQALIAPKCPPMLQN